MHTTTMTAAGPSGSARLASLSGETAAPDQQPRGAREIQNISHPKFAPTYLTRSTTSPLDTETDRWITPLRAPAYFPLDVFHSVLHELAYHPEQNSGLILRAEPLPDSDVGRDEDAALGERLGLDMLTRGSVRFIPRQPQRDSRIDQQITAYSSASGDRGLVVKTPQACNAAEVPFYHPPVRRLAFLWDTEGADEEYVEEEGKHRIYGTISVAYLPFEDTPCGTEFLAPHPRPPRRRSPLAPASSDGVVPPPAVMEEDTPEAQAAAKAEAQAVAERRLQRTCLALLERLHKHGHGSAQGYVKRVLHDVGQLSLPT
jgi:tRNASer (uridine44-2'-O)-methyltransferase